MAEGDIIIPFPNMSAPTVSQRNDRADLIDKIKPEQVIEMIRHRLMGEIFQNGKWVAVPGLSGKKKLSPAGAWGVSDNMMGVSTISTSISKLDDREIKGRLLGLTRSTQLDIVANWRSYGITNTAQMWFVHNLIFTNALVVLKQADEASIQELLKGTVQENRNVNTERREPTGGRIKRLLGMGQ